MCGLALFGPATPALANKIEFTPLDRVMFWALLLGVATLLVSLLVLPVVLALGRRRARPAPWKRVVAWGGIGLAGFCTAVDLYAMLDSLMEGVPLVSGQERINVALLLLAFTAVPLGVSVLAVWASLRLLGRNPKRSGTEAPS